ncbi:MAG: hypothetical protein LBF22_06125 [Deltaproteobacteria bacterium]|nr:hypothetical protein [Deltaproteobacteria bacterium]
MDSQRYQVSVSDPATDLARLVADAPNLDLPCLSSLGWGARMGLSKAFYPKTFIPRPLSQGLLSPLGLPYMESGVLASARYFFEKNQNCQRGLIYL